MSKENKHCKLFSVLLIWERYLHTARFPLNWRMNRTGIWKTQINSFPLPLFFPKKTLPCTLDIHWIIIWTFTDRTAFFFILLSCILFNIITMRMLLEIWMSRNNFSHVFKPILSCFFFCLFFSLLHGIIFYIQKTLLKTR